MSYISFEEVSKIYKMGEVEIKAIDKVSFDIDKGQFVVILGASGAGKTTILNLLGGMDSASEGKIIVDNQNIASFSAKQLAKYRRNDIGFVFQFYNLMQNLTAIENVQLACSASKVSFDPEEILKMVGLGDRLNNFPSQLSGGEQQRVAIARAISKKPKLLLCDEPTGALDYQTGKQVLQILQDLSQSQKMTVIMITHNAALKLMGEKVIHVRSGRIENVEINEKTLAAKDIEY